VAPDALLQYSYHAALDGTERRPGNAKLAARRSSLVARRSAHERALQNAAFPHAKQFS
jgi:hypothetical protein